MTAILAFWTACAWQVATADEPTIVKLIVGETAESDAMFLTADGKEMSESDQNLLAFCETAILQTRGMAVSPFMLTDRLLLEAVIPKEGFLQQLDKIPAPTWPAVEERREHRWKLRQAKSNGESRLDQHLNDPFHQDVEEKLSPSQLARLPAVYLRLEGAMALARPEFLGIFDKVESQATIRQKVIAAYDASPAELHRGVYFSVGKEVMPLLRAQLRRKSAEFDRQIVFKVLSAKERERLADYLAKTNAIEKVIDTSPLH